MRVRLAELREAAFRRIGDGDPERAHRFLEETATAQIEELFEYAWVAVREGEGEEGYASAREEAERLLGARKNMRLWAQPTSWASDGVPKSSLDGVRESVLHEDIYPQPVIGPVSMRLPTAEQRRRWYGVHKSERLCGVGLFKRWGVQLDADGRANADRFFSTAHVAALPLMIGIGGDLERNPGLATAWEELQRAAGPAVEQTGGQLGRHRGALGNTDGSLLFVERLAVSLDDLGHARRSDVTTAALDALRTFLARAGRGEPVPYYAILVADGDRMGAVIDNQRSPDAHRSLSEALDTFARGARAIVQDHDGCLIYAGGDDVLAFLPLHHAIECARALSESFTDRLKAWRTSDGDTATLSAGIGIAHCLDPMGAALDVARNAERVAKGHPDKNALAMALDKRSGGLTVVCGHWDSLVSRLLDLAVLHEADAIPDKAAHELSQLAHLTDGASAGELGSLNAIQRSEAMRILGRKRAKRGKEKIAKDALERLQKQAVTDPVALGREIAIMALIAKAKAQACPTLEEGV